MRGAYLLGGIPLLSELPLPELPPAPEAHTLARPVTIRVGEVPRVLPGAVALDADCFATPSHYLLRITGIAEYLVRDGQEVIVSPAEGALALDVRAYLLSTIFVILCHQRGLWPLHASAVRAEEGVVAFLGHSGQGKSSLAAHFARRGYSVVADDICLTDEAGLVTPTAPWLKLWRTSLDHLGQGVDALPQVFSEDDKYRLPVDAFAEPLPLRTLIFLDRGETVQLEPLSPFQAVPRLMNLTHQAYILEATGQREANFHRAGRVAAQTTAYRLERPWGLQYLEPTLDLIEQGLDH